MHISDEQQYMWEMKTYLDVVCHHEPDVVVRRQVKRAKGKFLLPCPPVVLGWSYVLRDSDERV